MSSVRSRNWCFTLNNYTPGQVEALKEMKCRYVVFGKEVGASGTPHLQGTIVFANSKSFSSVKAVLVGSPHIESCKDLQASIEEGNGYLMMVRNGRLSLPGVGENQAGAVAGGFVVSDRTAGTEFAPIFDRGSMRGVWD